MSGVEEWGLRFYSQDTTRPLTPGEWIHVVAVYDPGDMDTTLAGVRIYKNGVLRKGPRRAGRCRVVGDVPAWLSGARWLAGERRHQVSPAASGAS